jgi:hypothetical protein
MKTKFSKNSVITTVSIIVLVLALVDIYAGFSLYARFWHAFHGSWSKCGDFIVPVPKWWWAENKGCSLITPYPRFSFWTQTPNQMFLKLLATPSVKDSKWRQDVVKSFGRDGVIVNGTKDIAVASIHTVCFEFPAQPFHARALGISCNIDRRAVVTFYYDDPKLQAEFYGILASVRLVNSPGDPTHGMMTGEH